VTKSPDTAPAASRSGSSVVRIGIRLGAGLLILFVSFGAFHVLRENRPRPAQVQDAGSVRLVRVVDAQSTAVARSFTGFGSTRAVRQATVAAELTAQVTERPDWVQAGRKVEANAVLFRLDPDVFRERRNAAASTVVALEADLDSLDVELESSQERLRLSEQAIALLDNELTELESALDRGAAVQIEVDRLRRQRTSLEGEREALRQVLNAIPSRRAALQARIASQRAELALAEIDLARSVVRSPISGVIAEVFSDAGDLVASGAPLARIVDLSTIEVPLQIPAAASRRVAVGARAVVREPSGAGKEYAGAVVRIAPEIDPASRTFTVFVEVEQRIEPGEFDSSREYLFPGQFVSGTIESSTTTRSLVIPRVAVDSDRVMVLDEESGTAQPRTAQVAYYTDQAILPDSEWDQWAVLDTSGPLQAWQPPMLEAGDRVIVSNLDELPAGTAVRIEDRLAERR